MKMHNVLEEGGRADSAEYGCAKGMKWADLENLSTTVSVTTSSTRTHGAPREPAEMCSLSVMRAGLDDAAVWSEAVMSKVGPDTMSATSTSTSWWERASAMGLLLLSLYSTLKSKTSNLLTRWCCGVMTSLVQRNLRL